MIYKFEKILKDKIIISLLILAIINIFVCFYIRGPIVPGGDSVSYFEAARFLKGDDMGGDLDFSIIYNRLLTAPLFISLIGILGSVFGIYNSMLLVNIFFYLGLVLSFYFLALEVLENKKIAFFSSWFIFLNYGIINFGIAHLTDIGGWAFFVLSSFLAVRYFKRKEKKDYWWAILFSIFGVFLKEYGGLGMISLILLIIFSEKNKKEKIKECFISIFVFSLVLGFYHYFFYTLFHYSYFNWYQFNINYYLSDSVIRESSYSLILLGKVLGWLFLGGWPIFVFGLWKILKEKWNKEGVIFLALLPASLSFLAWPVMTQRIAFVLIPWLALVSGFGLSKIKSNLAIVLILIFYGVLGYSTNYLMGIINL